MSTSIDYLIMKMWSGRSSGISALSDALTSLDLHSFCHAYGFKMGISCLITEPVVDEHRIAITEKFKPDRFHHTVTGGIYRVARLKSEVHAAMLF